ncbi:Hypothetical predicted protein [Prunus dulcis]|uniref:Uncharacterized protein n=1 Tax=Prunus dulcis TaxID=3755 RepID=A0A5E4F3A1_PRUDU|nr:Hypothetical predicted protein [Prunus dulcis]
MPSSVHIPYEINGACATGRMCRHIYNVAKFAKTGKDQWNRSNVHLERSMESPNGMSDTLAS